MNLFNDLSARCLSNKVDIFLLILILSPTIAAAHRLPFTQKKIMPLTVGNVVSGAGSADCYEPFNTIFSVFETFPDVVPTKTLELAAAQLQLNGIDVVTTPSSV